MQMLSRLLALCVVTLIMYVACWMVRYHAPSNCDVTLDCRSTAAGWPLVIIFRSSLASKKFAGFPGHAYVLFGHGESFGYVPKYSRDQIPSLWRPVAGLMQPDSEQWNTENVSEVGVIVDPWDYFAALKAAQEWDVNNFQVGTHDCVAFVHAVASNLPLQLPNAAYRYPQDYIHDLARLNSKLATRNPPRPSELIANDNRSSANTGNISHAHALR